MKTVMMKMQEKTKRTYYVAAYNQSQRYNSASVVPTVSQKMMEVCNKYLETDWPRTRLKEALRLI